MDPTLPACSRLKARKINLTEYYDLVYEYKFESSSLKSQRENCFSMSENDSLKTYDMITPWVHSNAEATLTHKFSSTKTMMFPKLETQKISRVPDCSIPINAPKEQFKSYPNPFYKEIEFEYNLNESSDVSFVFYNIQGSVVYQTKTSLQQIGMYKTSFDCVSSALIETFLNRSA